MAAARMVGGRARAAHDRATSEPSDAPDQAAAFADRVRAAVASISDRAAAIAAGRPLPPGARVGHDEDAWGPREVLAHVGEAVPYWHGEIERILAADPSAGPAPFGRTTSDGPRAAIIERDRTLPVPFLVSRLQRDAAALVARVRVLSPDDLARMVRHPAWGDLTLGAMVDRTLASHLEGHVAQLRGLLDG